VGYFQLFNNLLIKLQKHKAPLGWVGGATFADEGLRKAEI